MRYTQSVTHPLVSPLLVSVAFCVSTAANAVAVSYTPASPLQVPFSSQLWQNGGWNGSVQTLDLDIDGNGSIDLILDNVRRTSYGEWRDESDPEWVMYGSWYSRENMQNITSVNGNVEYHIFEQGEETAFHYSYLWTTLSLWYENESSDEYCDPYGCTYNGGPWEEGVFYDWYGLMGGRGYIGFTFDANGNTHWGWIDLTVSLASVSVNGWGWETEVNTPIGAGLGSPVPVPASLWLLGSGLVGMIGAGRRRLG